MSKPGRFQSQRVRAAVGATVVAAALAAAGVVVGGGVAKTSLTPTGTGTTTTVPAYGKVAICHKTHSKKHPSVTVTISVNAWPAHNRHGDTVGACSPAVGTTTTTTSSSTTTTTAASAPGKSGTRGNSQGHSSQSSSHGRHH